MGYHLLIGREIGEDPECLDLDVMTSSVQVLVQLLDELGIRRVVVRVDGEVRQGLERRQVYRFIRLLRRRKVYKRRNTLLETADIQLVNTIILYKLQNIYSYGYIILRWLLWLYYLEVFVVAMVTLS